MDIQLRDIISWAVEAGHKIEEIRREPSEVQEKEDGSPLTRADLASHRIIADKLEQSGTDFPVISEESWEGSDETFDYDSYWLVDPLDGTKEFIKGLDEFTVNIAFVSNNKPVAGVIYLPATQVLYYAEADTGAFKRDAEGNETPLCPGAGQASSTAVVSRSHMSEETEGFLAKLGIQATIARGSSLKMCAVAEGEAAIYPRFGPTCYWDTAAGAAIADAAGCQVVDKSGNPICYDLSVGIKHAGFVVYNPALCDPNGFL